MSSCVTNPGIPRRSTCEVSGSCSVVSDSLPRRRHWHPTPVLLPGKSHGWRSLVGCSPRGRKESDTTEWLHFHFPLACIGIGNGSPLQCSCLENPRDGGACGAAIYGVAQSWRRLKWLSSSSSSVYMSVLLSLNSSHPLLLLCLQVRSIFLPCK